MKTINSFRSKLFAFTLALVASVSSFAYDEMPDFQVDGLYYNFLEGDNVEVTHPYIPVVPVENVASNTKKKSHAISADDYYNLTNLVIPSTVTYEGKVYKVTRIGFDAFNQCDKLTFVDIPSSVKTIGVGAFNFCSSLTSITLKEGLEHIEWNAFEDCRSLENITFPNSLKTIGNYAFSNTLWYKNHPNGAVYASNVFYKYKGDIPQNTSFVIKEGTVSISPYAFVKENYHEDYSLVSVSIPNSVKVIGEGVFYRCRALTSIVIPDGVTTIETLAFHYCKALNSVTCKAVEPPVLGSSVFSVVPLTDATLYVPAESVDAYKNADQWKDFGQILPIEPTSYKSQWCNQWNILEYNVSGMGIPEETWRYYLAEDITINGTTYTTVNRYWTADKTKCGSVATIRFTENQKVYALLGDTEYLVYDFSVQVGDTIETIVGVNYGTMLQQLLVHQIDIAMPTGPKTITLYPICKMEDGECDDCDEDGHYLWECCPIEWIEGIGSTDGFLMGYPPCGHVGGIGHKLLCAYKDDELQYINELYQDDYGCEYNAGPFNEKLLGTWRVVGGNEIISISDSIIVFKYLGLTQKYTASATQLTVERLWIPEEESYRWANCNYTLSNDTLWIDNFMPLLVATYPPTFGPITLVKVKHEDLFPTLWGLQRTVCNEYCGDTEDDNSANFTYKQTFDSIFFENDKPYILCNGYLLREEDNKIFLYSQSLNKDIVLYDFTLEVGDSLPAYIKDFDGTIYPADTFVVTDISNVTLLDGKEYKKWTFDNGMEYVEGIGMYGGHRNGNFFGLIQEIVVPCHTGTHLVCVSKNNKLLYQMDEAEMERLGAECLCEAENPEDLFPTLWGLQRTTFYHYTECSDSYSSLTASNEIVTINDKPYLRFGKMFLREENNQVLIYSAAYDKDLVLYDWNVEVGDSISLLAMDYGVYPEYAVSVVDYRVIVDIDENGDLIMDTIPTDKVVVDKISTITLLDGKEYKTWHLATGWAGEITYVEGIGILSEGYGGGDYLGLIRPEELPTCYYGDLLVCVSKNNKLLYQMDPVKMDELGTECLCDYDRGPRKDNAKNGKIGGRPTPTQWNMLEVETKEMDGTPTILRAETFSYTLENDSIVTKGKTYYQLARQSTKDTATTKSVVGALHFGKAEDNRVYFLRDGVEYVLYDFTAEIGDTVEIFAGINNYPHDSVYTHVVTGKDTLENGACRMLLEVVFPDETTAENAEKVWLAGLGSVDGIVHNAAKRTSNAHAAPSRCASSSETESSVMLCAWREDSCLYTTNHPEYDTFGCVYNQDPTAVEDLTSPSSYQKIIHEGTLLILHEGKVYNVIGIQIK